MAMQFHYGPTGKPTTSYGSPLRGTAFDAMRTRPLSAFDTMRTRPLGQNYVYDAMRTRPIAQAGLGDATATAGGMVKTLFDAGAGYVLGIAAAPSEKDKVLYGVVSAVAAGWFGVVGLAGAVLALKYVKK